MCVLLNFEVYFSEEYLKCLWRRTDYTIEKQKERIKRLKRAADGQLNGLSKHAAAAIKYNEHNQLRPERGRAAEELDMNEEACFK